MPFPGVSIVCSVDIFLLSSKRKNILEILLLFHKRWKEDIFTNLFAYQVSLKTVGMQLFCKFQAFPCSWWCYHCWSPPVWRKVLTAMFMVNCKYKIKIWLKLLWKMLCELSQVHANTNIFIYGLASLNVKTSEEVPSSC